MRSLLPANGTKFHLKMKFMYTSVIALMGGVFLAIQAGFNSQLGSQLKNPVIAVISTSLFSFILSVFVFWFSGKDVPSLNEIKRISWYLWGIGSLFSVVGISIYFYTIPKIGIATMITLGLVGQLVFAIVAGHFGWLGTPKEPLTFIRLLGALCLLSGIVLINIK